MNLSSVVAVVKSAWGYKLSALRRGMVIWCVFGLLSVFTGAAHATPYTWLGSAASGSTTEWTNPLNWSPSTGYPGDAAGAASLTDTATFSTAGAGGQTITIASNVSVNAITFSTTGWVISSAVSPAITLVGTTPTITASAGSSTISAVVSGTAGLTKAGSGTLILSSANSYSGTTAISVGNLKLGNNTAAGTSSITTPTGGATLQLADGVNVSNALTTALTSNYTPVIDVPDANASATYSGNVSFSGGSSRLILAATGLSAKLTLTGSTTGSGAQGGMGISAGNVVFAGSAFYGSKNTAIIGFIGRGASTSVTVQDNATLNLNSFTFGGGVTASGATFSLTVGGTGSATFQTPTAGTAGSIGAINLLSSGSSTNQSSTINLNSGGTIATGGFNKSSTGTSTLNFSGGTLKALQSNTTFLPAAAGLTANVGTGGALVNTNTFNITIAQSLVGSASDGGLTKSSTGTLLLTGTNTYNGATIINSGTIQAGAANTLSPNSGVYFPSTSGAANAVLDLNNFNQTIASLNGDTTPGNVTLGSGILTFGDANSFTYAGVISGSGNLTKQGAGTQTLMGTSTFAGTTTISAGTLLVNGALSSSGGVSVNGGTLGGTGTVGSVTEGTTTGTMVAPATLGTIGTLNIADSLLSSAGVLKVDVNPTASSADLLNVTGAINLAGSTLSLNLLSAPTANGQTFTILNSTGGITGNFAQGTTVTGTFNSTTYTFTITYNANSVVLTTTGISSANQPPVNTVPGTQTTAEDTTLAFNGNLLISDPDAGSNAVQVTLHATNGSISLNGTSGLTITSGANNSPDVTFTGTIAAINTALNGLSYVPFTNYTGTGTLTITTNDLGNSGSGGAQQASNTISITITAVNDAPTANADTYTVAQSASMLLDVLSNDSIAPDAGQTLTLTSVSTANGTTTNATTVTTAGGGTVNIENGKVRYIAPASGSSDSFSYIVTDNGTTNGTPDPKSATANVTISLTTSGAVTAAANVTVTQGGFVRGSGLTRYRQTITLTNNSGADVTGPIYVVFGNLNVTLVNADGTSSSSPIGPYVRIGGTLMNGASTSFIAEYEDPSRAHITYTPRVLVGAGTP